MTLYDLEKKTFEHNSSDTYLKYKKLFTDECKKLLEKGVFISNESMAKWLSKKTGSNWFYRCEKQGNFSEKTHSIKFKLYAGFVNPSSLNGESIKNKYDIAFSNIDKFDEDKEFFFDNMLHSLNWFEVYVDSLERPMRPHFGEFMNSVIKEIPCNPIHEAEIQFCNRYTDSERTMEEVVVMIHPVVKNVIVELLKEIKLPCEVEEKVESIAKGGRGGK